MVSEVIMTFTKYAAFTSNDIYQKLLENLINIMECLTLKTSQSAASMEVAILKCQPWPILKCSN